MGAGEASVALGLGVSLVGTPATLHRELQGFSVAVFRSVSSFSVFVFGRTGWLEDAGADALWIICT